MFGLCFPTLVCLCCMLFSCYGKIISPAQGTKYIFLPGSNGTIPWELNDDIKNVTYRYWYFCGSKDGKRQRLAYTVGQGQPRDDRKLKLKIINDTKLLLIKVDQSYNGTYEFKRDGRNMDPDTASVAVFIAAKPNVSMNCLSHVTLNENESFTCVCRGEGGNPPANVTWYKDGDSRINGTEKKQKTLTLSNVNKSNSGNYTCLAESYSLPEYADNGTLVVLVTSQEQTVPTIPSPDPRSTEPSKEKNGQTQTTTSSTSTIKPSPTTQNIASPTVARTVTSTTKQSSSSLPIWLIVLIVVIILLILLIIGIVVYCYKMEQTKQKTSMVVTYRRGNSNLVTSNDYELENEDAGPADNAYDSVAPVGTSSGKSKPAEKNTLPPVYAAVDKNNRQGNTLYASLDTDAMKPKRESKKEPERTPQTEYASIDFAKSSNAPQG